MKRIRDDLVAYHHAKAEDQISGGICPGGAFLLFGLFNGGKTEFD